MFSLGFMSVQQEQTKEVCVCVCVCVFMLLFLAFLFQNKERMEGVPSERTSGCAIAVELRYMNTQSLQGAKCDIHGQIIMC